MKVITLMKKNVMPFKRKAAVLRKMMILKIVKRNSFMKHGHLSLPINESEIEWKWFPGTCETKRSKRFCTGQLTLKRLGDQFDHLCGFSKNVFSKERAWRY